MRGSELLAFEGALGASAAPGLMLSPVAAVVWLVSRVLFTAGQFVMRVQQKQAAPSSHCCCCVVWFLCTAGASCSGDPCLSLRGHRCAGGLCAARASSVVCKFACVRCLVLVSPRRLSHGVHLLPAAFLLTLHHLQFYTMDCRGCGNSQAEKMGVDESRLGGI